MPPVQRPVCCFAAEPPQEDLARGRWAQLLRSEFLAACEDIDAEPERIGEPGPLVYHPDRTWSGRTYVPITARTDTGVELYGFVSFYPSDPDDDQEAFDFQGWADYTDETADDHPEWRLDLNEALIGEWRGEAEQVAAMTLIWGRRLLDAGTMVTAELADTTVDQGGVVEERFTLVAPDAYGGDYLKVVLWDEDGSELARESLYEDDEDEEEGDGRE